MILGIFGASSAPSGPPRGPKRGPRHEKRCTLQSTIVTKATDTIRNVWLMKIKNCLITTTLPWISTLCNELSEVGHMLLDAMSSSRAALVERTTGIASHDAKVEKGIIQGELRRQLSVVNLWASMSCLLDRLHQCTMGCLGSSECI